MTALDNLFLVLDNFLLIALPYIALFGFLIGSIWRYRTTKFKVSSLSSQFLERKRLFLGSVPFHWGLMVLFFGHLIGFLIPSGVLAWNSHPVRLVVIEVSAFIFGIAALVGLINLFIRRTSDDRLRMVTSNMDILVEILLLVQLVTGLWIAYNFRWGSSWFASVLTPYLRSIFIFQPDIAAVSPLPWVIKLHITGAYLIILLIPFSRLMHFLVPPINYLWRPYQQVTWYWERRQVREPKSSWSPTRPKNN